MATRRAPASHDDELDDTQEQLLSDIAALEEVDTCSSLVLQELLQRKPSSPPLLPPPSSAASRKAHLESKQSPPSTLHTQQVNHHPPLQTSRPHHHPSHAQNHDPHPNYSAQMPDVQNDHPCRNRCRPHPLRHVVQSCRYQQQPGAGGKDPASLLHQVLECSTENFAMGLMSSDASLSSQVMNGNSMTLPALSSEPTKSRKKAPVSALRKVAGRAAGENSWLESVEYLPPKQAAAGTSLRVKKSTTPACAQAKQGIPGNHFFTERQRREFLNEKYHVLRSLIPNPSKADRASIVQDAIDYVNELKQCADKLRCERDLGELKRRKVVDAGLGRGVEVFGDKESCKGKQHFSSASKGGKDEKNACTLSHITSRYGTDVDVRVFEDEATIKVTRHQSRGSLLLDAVVVLNEAELELLHASGARIGNCHVYMLNVKIHERRMTHASLLARKLMERMDASLEQALSTRSSS